nr:hypothetical protein [Streptosporangium amethystogenes]
MPVFATAGIGGMSVYVVVFLLLIAVWRPAGRFFAAHPVVAKTLSRQDHGQPAAEGPGEDRGMTGRCRRGCRPCRGQAGVGHIPVLAPLRALGDFAAQPLAVRSRNESFPVH